MIADCTVTPNQTYGIIVDKMTQRLYLYKEGKLLTTLLCSTGTTGGSNEDYNETASGEFLWTPNQVFSATRS